MDQVKTGRFIQSLRREKELTQLQLAGMLGISDKTVSKWERGAGLPDVGSMLPLCETLGISVNELLTGERLSPSEYQEKAEENIMDLVRENKTNRKRMLQSAACATVTVIAVTSLVMLASLLEMPAAVRILVIMLALGTAVLGIGAACTLDIEAGHYECPECGALFVPRMSDYVKGCHTFTKRRLTCPECGKTSMCRHRLVR